MSVVSHAAVGASVSASIVKLVGVPASSQRRR
jgi:hypothetical protein